jgi:serine/threonine-protein kinase HipA
MATDEQLHVELADRDSPLAVGALRDVGDGPYFAYDAEMLAAGLRLAPLHLPLRADAFPPGPRHQHRLRGLFADSIPDGWGLRILHQALRDAGLDPLRASPLTLLRAIGLRGSGALVYHPAQEIWGAEPEGMDLDALAEAAFRVEADEVAMLPSALRRAAGASGGARPKVSVAWHPDGRVHDSSERLRAGFRHVLIKLRARGDDPALPAVEGAYLQMARAAGLEVPAHHVVPLASGELGLVVERFDRVGNERRHVQTLAALLEADPANDLIDYANLLSVAKRVTGSFTEMLKALRLAAFNVLAGNRDDHARNVSFVMAPDGTWRLAPAYDLTPTPTGTGYHAMSVGGESLNPGPEDVLRIGVEAGLDRHQVVQVLDEVRGAVGRWGEFAEAGEVPSEVRKRVAAWHGLACPESP